MDLTKYIRNKINNKLILLVMEDKCEICGCEDDLEVHHVYSFKDILDDTLELLNLEEKDTNEYTKDELYMITTIVLGKHLDISYKTLCSKCHHDIHKSFRVYSRYNTRNSYGEKYWEKDWCLPNELLNTWITLEQIKQFIQDNELIGRNGNYIGIKVFRKELPNHNYIMVSKRKRINGKHVMLYKITKK